jgi:predicted PhzF superfamily epimerase YddE/YHI9
MSVPYWVVDAFTDRVFAGNPAAVVLLERFPAEAQLLAVAAENNLSETAFLVPDGAGWRLRWFTPTVEVELCGHATLASAFVLRRLGHAGPFRFATRSGPLAAWAEGEGLVIDLPARAAVPVEDAEDEDLAAAVAAALGAAPAELLRSADLIAVMDDPATVAGLRPDARRVAALPGGAVIVTAAGGAGADVTSRYFAPGYGIEEDPVTGALHTQVVPFWAARLGRARLDCVQASRRGGRMRCTLDGGRVRIEGRAALYAEGRIFLPGPAPPRSDRIR